MQRPARKNIVRKLLRIIEPNQPEDTPEFASGLSIFTPARAARSRSIAAGENSEIGKYRTAAGGASIGRTFSWPTFR